jgi:hypothetical protein
MFSKHIDKHIYKTSFFAVSFVYLWWCTSPISCLRASGCTWTVDEKFYPYNIIIKHETKVSIDGIVVKRR